MFPHLTPQFFIKGLVCLIISLPILYILVKKRPKKTQFYFLRPENNLCQQCCIKKKSCCNLKTCSFKIFETLFSYINSAQTSLELCSPSLRYRLMVDAIKRANANNVKVRIITSNIGSMIECLAQGIPIKGHDCNQQCYLLHNKFIIIDGKILIRSSLNFTTTFLEGRCENLQIIFDQTKILWYQSLFEEIWRYQIPCLKCQEKNTRLLVPIETATPTYDALEATPINMSAPLITLNNGLSIPSFGIGTWQAPPGEVGRAVKLAIDAGYRHIDCALLYQNEKEIGEAIREKIKEGVVERKDLFITSKLWNSYHRPDLVIKGCKKTLRNFGLDYIDLYLIHWPFGFKPSDRADAESKELGYYDAIMSEDEFWPRDANGKLIFSDDDYVDTWKEMEKCVELGLTKSIGVSNFNEKQLERLLASCKIKPVNNQIEIHPYLTQKEIRYFCRNNDITVTAYCPLGQYSQSGKDTGFVQVLENPTVLKIAEELNKTPAQVVLRYLIQLQVIPIPKSTNPTRLKLNYAVFDFELSEKQMNNLALLDSNKRICPMAGCESHKYYPF